MRQQQKPRILSTILSSSIQLVLLLLLSLNWNYSNHNLNIIFVNALASASTSNVKKGGAGFGIPKVINQYHVDDSIEIQALLQFLTSQSMKADINNGIEIGIHPTTGQRGLYATKNFNSKNNKNAGGDFDGKIICKIPSSLVLAVSDPSLGGADVPTIAHCGLNFIQMYGNHNHNNNRQQWLPYLNTLPKDGDATFSNSLTPDFMSYDEIDLLEFPRMVQCVQERKRAIEQLAADHADTITVPQLQYATWIISSRSFQLAIADMNPKDTVETADAEDTTVQYDERGQVITKAGMDRQYIRVLIPYIDMVNHSSDKPNVKLTVLDPQKDDSWFVLETIRPIRAGDELLLSYGSTIDSTIELCSNYGFVPSTPNPIDTFMLQKGGPDCLASLSDWSTSLEEDRTLLNMMESEEENDANNNLRKILQFRIRLKESYK